MRSSAPTGSTRFRITFLAVVAIIIPSIVLSVFGLKLNNEQLHRIEDVVLQAYRAAAQTMVAHIVGEIKRVEQKALYDIRKNAPGRWLEALSMMEEQPAILDGLFLLNGEKEIIYPGTRPEIIPEAMESTAGPAGGGLLLRAGYVLEFKQNDPKGAIDNYQRCAEGPFFSVALRIEALASLGGCLYKLGRYEEAAGAYARITSDFGAKDVPVPYRLLARYQGSISKGGAGHWRAAISGLLALYRDLLKEPMSPSGEDCWEFFLGRAREKLSELMGSGEVTAEQSELFKKLREQESRRKMRHQLRRDLEQWLAERVAWELRADAESGMGVRHFHQIVKGRPYVVGYIVGSDERVGETYALGFKLNLDYIRGQVVPRVVRDQQLGKGAVVALLGRDGKPIVSLRSGGDAGAGAAGWGTGGRYVAQRFPEYLGFWRIGIRGIGDEELLHVGWQQYLLLNGILLVTIVTMIAGVYFTLRNVNREMELSALKSEFVSRVSHELKTPLSLIRMFAETLLLGRATSKEKEREYYEIINRESERLTKLIDHVLDFSRIESGRKEYHFELEDVVEVVEWTAEAYREELEAKGFRFEIELPEGPLYSYVDRDGLDQALINLLNNAEKYSRDTKEIRVAVRQDGDEIRIEVSDRGIGIPKEEQAKVFERFYRVKDKHVSAVRGSGLGLAIASHALKAHRGRIELASKPGEGSTFTLVLPIAGDGVAPTGDHSGRVETGEAGDEALNSSPEGACSGQEDAAPGTGTPGEAGGIEVQKDAGKRR